MNFNAFTKYLHNFQPLSPEMVKVLEQFTERIYFSKNEILFARGKIAHKIVFIECGTLAAYRETAIKEIVTRFWLKEQLICPSFSLFQNQQMPEKIIALEDCTLNSITFSKLQLFLKEYPEACLLFHKVIASQQYYYQEWAFSLASLSYEERYKYFVSHYNKLFNLVTAEAIADFLNMSSAKLSRLRKA